jgi:5-methylcytosine-specific restriction endonuclease McrA
MKVADLSDAQLLESLKSLCGQGRAVLARLLAHLVEVEERRLHLEAACPSMFQFCVRRLGMSEDEACRRIHAARLTRRFPDLVVRIERGDLTLSTIAILSDTLTEATYEELVEAAAGKTKAEVQTLLAKRFPAPDVPAAVTAIPTQPPVPALGVEAVAAAAVPPAAAGGRQIVPLSETRHKVQFTASDELRKKLERALDLMRHANAEGDLAFVIERAVDLLLEKLEKQRLGKTSRPRQSREHTDTGRVSRATPSREDGTARVSRATRRAVFERDGERCTFTDPEAHRCPATSWLELDHVVPRARGGTSEVGNLRVRCRAHNALYAEQTFGKEHIERRIRERRDPRQRGYASDSCDLAASGLVNMGFRRAEVQRALDTVEARHRADDLSTIPVQTILREALAVMTQGPAPRGCQDMSRSAQTFIRVTAPPRRRCLLHDGGPHPRRLRGGSSTGPLSFDPATARAPSR